MKIDIPIDWSKELKENNTAPDEISPGSQKWDEVSRLLNKNHFIV